MTLQYLIDTNTLSEPTRRIPNARVLEKPNVHKSEIDGQIASITYCNNLVLVTNNNVSDFQEFDSLRIENWFVS